MELLLLILAVVAGVLVVRYGLKKYDAKQNNEEFNVQPLDFAKSEVKHALDVNNDGKVDLADAVEAAGKVKKAAKKVKEAAKKPGRKKKLAE